MISGQPTSHFTVLEKAGVDPKRVIIDERAPLFYVGLQDCIPSMLFLIADNDMQNRYEQTMLMLSTLKHFGFDETRIKFRLLHGTHCEHCFAKEEDGTSVFGNILLDYFSEILRW